MSTLPNHENLEFNDGVGDLLRERRPDSHSLKKSTWLVGGVVVVAVFIFAILFKLGSRLLFTPPGTQPTVSSAQSSDRSVDAENQRLIREMEALLAEASANVDVETRTTAVAPPKPSATATVNASPAAVVTPVHPPVASPKKYPVRTRTIHTRSIQARPVQVKPAEPLVRVAAGVFSSRAEAVTVGDSLKGRGYTYFIREENARFIVQVGAFRSRDVADSVVSDLTQKGYSAVLLSQ